MAKAPVIHIPVATLEHSLGALCGDVKTQSGQHIKLVHSHCSDRLVVEGGFPPEWVHPRPPLTSKAGPSNTYGLAYSEEAKNSAEQSVLGGMKYKNLDVAVLPPGIGPALGVSVKSTGNAFRNLTNRMEEAPGDCVNIHMMYPGFVFGFLHLIKFARVGDGQNANDASFDADDQPFESIVRYHNALCALTGRVAIADPTMRYESIGLLVYRCLEGKVEIWPKFPAVDSPVHYSKFFQRLYDAYDLRYAYPDATGRNHRKSWTVSGGILEDTFDASTGHPWHSRATPEKEKPA
ncbi:MAG: hypothetical protein ABSG10_10255 [Terracidiphilus sp.]|jgi:hypothetical protein